jgi:hypothetical protein
MPYCSLNGKRSDPQPSLSKPFQTMAAYNRQIPRLTEAEFNAAFLLFSEGMRVNPELSRSPAVMGALNAFRSARILEIKLPGEQ